MVEKGIDGLWQGKSDLCLYMYRFFFLYIRMQYIFTFVEVIAAVKPEKCLGKICLTLKLRANS